MLNKYDPRLKNQEELQATLICGQKILKEIYHSLVNGKDRSASNQSWIITGPRGAGKSHLLTLLYRQLLADPETYSQWQPILFPEELFHVDSLYRLLLTVFDRLIKETDLVHASIHEKFNHIKQTKFAGNIKQKSEQRRRLAKELLDLLDEIHKDSGKKLILMLENLQELMRTQIDEDDLKLLRSFLIEHSDVMIIMGTALSVFDEVENYGKPFYHFFRIRHLDGLSRNEMLEFLKKIAAAKKQEHMHARFQKNRAHLYTYWILTGGNPRLIMLIYELLLAEEKLHTDMILEKITELTPYFRDRTLEASPQRKTILNALALGAPAQTATEIASYAVEDQRSVTEQLKRMKLEGWVREIAIEGEQIKQKETFFTLRDYFYRIWYKLRTGGIDETEIHCLAELTVLLYDRSSLLQLLDKNNNLADDRKQVFVYAQSLMDDRDYIKNIEMLKVFSENEVSHEIEEIVEQCYNYFDKSEWKDLLRCAERLLEYDEGKLFAYFYIGICYGESGNFEESIHFYEKAIEIKPDMYEAWFNMGYVYGKSGNFKESIRCYEKVIEIEQNDNDVWNNMGISYDDLGNFEESIRCYEKAIEIKPDMHEAWNNMGYVYGKSGNFEKSIHCYKKAIEIKPDMHEAWNNMGYVYREFGNFEESIRCYEKEIEIKPDDNDAWYNMGNGYRESGNLEESIRCYEKAIEIKQDMHEAWYNMGISYKESGNFEESIRCYEKAIEIKPDDNKAWYNMSFSYYKKQEYKKAWDAYIQSIQNVERMPSFTLSTINELRQISKQCFKPSEQFDILSGKKSTIQEKLEAFGKLLLSDVIEFDPTVLDALFEFKDWPEKSVKVIEFFLTGLIIQTLKEEPGCDKVAFYFKTWVMVMKHVYSTEAIHKKFMLFLFDYINFCPANELCFDEIEKMIKILMDEGYVTSDILFTILRAIQKPNSREAQKWMADPLFKEIVSQLSAGENFV